VKLPPLRDTRRSEFWINTAVYSLALVVLALQLFGVCCLVADLPHGRPLRLVIWSGYGLTVALSLVAFVRFRLDMWRVATRPYLPPARQ